MRKKLCDEIDISIKNNSFENVNANNKAVRKSIIANSLVFSVLLLIIFVASLLMIHNVSKLAFFNINIFIYVMYFVLVFYLLTAIIYIIIYNIYKDKDTTIKKLKHDYKTYQTIDSINFLSFMISLMVFVLLFFITPAEVKGSSMEPTYESHDRILVWHIGYKVTTNDVVIVDVKDKYFTSETDTEFIIKRVVASANDRVKYEEGFLVVNDVKIEEVSQQEYQKLLTFKNYTKNETSDDISFYKTEEVIMPEGYLIVLGDNRGVSNDSRNIGLIKETDILGKVIFRIYPFEKMGLVD